MIGVTILLAIWILPWLLTGCASTALGDHQQATQSTALTPPTKAPLIAQIQAESGKRPRQSGFYPLVDGDTALRARTALADVAVRSIDVQSYIWRNDLTGRLVLSRLLDAAERGVRVRILIDDIHKGEDRGFLQALDRHPLIEIRLFNPAQADSRGLSVVARSLEMVLDYDRLNHRMHNKLFLVDSSLMVVGGRNIGNEYFDHDGEKNFRDIDVLAGGPAAGQFARVFDQFWNATASVPVNDPGLEMQGSHTAEWAAMREQLLVATDEQAVIPEVDAAKSQPWLRSCIQRMIWAPARVLAASPDLVHNDEATSFADLLGKVPEPQEELLMETAYFIPNRAMIRKIREWHKKGVSTRILTNSMRSNDVLAAHAGYAKHREAVLASGAELYEWRSDNQPPKRKVGKGVYASRANLHTKAYVIDRVYTLIGSYNLDPRSSDLNTECGILIHSPEFAQQVAAVIEGGMQPTNSWKVTLGPKTSTRMQWQGQRSDAPVSFDEEPDSNFWERAQVKVLGLLPIDEAL